jgi:hypothetical protein
MGGFPSYYVKSAAEDLQPGLIDAQLINDLLTADLVIADLSTNNPNAFYEIGIRHMAQKPIIHIQLADEEIPFDVSLYRSVKFSLAKPSDLDKAQALLKGQVQAIQADGYQVENPVTNARGVVQLKEHATPRDQVLLDQIADLKRRVSAIEHSSIFTSVNELSPRASSTRASDLFEMEIQFKPTSEETKRELADVLGNMAASVMELPGHTGIMVVAPVSIQKRVYRLVKDAYQPFIGSIRL